MTLADSIFQSAVNQAKTYRDNVLNAKQEHAIRPKEETPIIRDMRTTARELGIVDALKRHQRLVYTRSGEAYDLVEECLIALGVSSRELLDNLERKD